jgi:hypothetical protein
MRALSVLTLPAFDVELLAAAPGTLTRLSLLANTLPHAFLDDLLALPARARLTHLALPHLVGVPPQRTICLPPRDAAHREHAARRPAPRGAVWSAEGARACSRCGRTYAGAVVGRAGEYGCGTRAESRGHFR